MFISAGAFIRVNTVKSDMILSMVWLPFFWLIVACFIRYHSDMILSMVWLPFFWLIVACFIRYQSDMILSRVLLLLTYCDFFETLAASDIVFLIPLPIIFLRLLDLGGLVGDRAPDKKG